MFYSVLLGKPTDHSISPRLFRMLGEQFGIDYGHIKIDVHDKALLPKYLEALKTLGFCGVNITLPYKIDVMDYIDKLDDSAKKCGAVNTIEFTGNIKKGYNTDAYGAIQAIEQKLRRLKATDKVCVFGAGGAARAVIYEIYKQTKNVSILNIDIEQAQKVSKDISGNKIEVYELSNTSCFKLINESDFVINTTPVGMFPNIRESVVSKEVLSKFKTLEGKYFFDAIFNPYKTKFILDAEKRGAKVCSGIYWMIFQAAAALKIWIKKDFSKQFEPDKIAESLRKTLHR